jgi:hypothetical protein
VIPEKSGTFSQGDVGDENYARSAETIWSMTPWNAGAPLYRKDENSNCVAFDYEGAPEGLPEGSLYVLTVVEPSIFVQAVEAHD